MRHPVLSTLSACVLALASLASPGASAQATPAAAPIPVETFFSRSTFGGAVFSPDAKFLAVSFGDGGNGRARLGVVDLINNTIKVVAESPGRDVSSFSWVNNNRLVFSTGDSQLGQRDQEYGAGLFGVNRDGSGLKMLVTPSGSMTSEQKHGRRALKWNHSLLPQRGRQDSDYVYVTSPQSDSRGELAYVNLLRLNTVDGTTQTFKRPGDVKGWMLDHQGEPRIAHMMEEDTASVWYLDPKTKEWRKIASFNPYLNGKDAFTPVAFAPDGTLYVRSNGGKDKAALYTFDFATNSISANPVMALEDFDFSGALVTSADRLLGISYLSDARANVWFDESMKKTQAAVDALLPNTVNLIGTAARAEMPWVLVRSYSDRDPGRYSLYNTETGKLNVVGEVKPAIKPAQMASQDFVKIKARDGLTIPAWVTKPNGPGKNLPMVVMVHGGPYVRGGEWGFSPATQFLASRGYVVVEPEFRGSTGFGLKHYESGWKQWGLNMQNDIADVTRWAVAQGIADGNRICIAGASYGGYATLMGLINDPDLYKCGVSWVGVTDISLLHSGHWSFHSDIGDGYKKHGMPILVGDVVKDAEQFKKTSPLVQAARIKQPVLLAYGAADVRVPLYHGQQFLAAVKKTNPEVDMIVYQEEGHGWALPKNQKDFWTKVETFLDKHIGKK